MQKCIEKKKIISFVHYLISFIFLSSFQLVHVHFHVQFYRERVELVCQVANLKSPISRRRCAMGRKDMILGNLLVCSHHSLICLLRTACFTLLALHSSVHTAGSALLAPHCSLCIVRFSRALQCAHSLARSPTQSLPSSRERGFSL